MMVGRVLIGTPGIILLVVIVLVLLCIAVLVVLKYTLKNKPKSRHSVYHKYAILKSQEDVAVNVKQNPIQPPSHANVKVRLIPPKLLESKRITSIKYSGEEEEERKEKILEKKNEEHKKPNSENVITFSNYREKFFGLLDMSNVNSKNNIKRHSKPDMVDVLDRNAFLRNKYRSRRPDSIYDEGIGKLTFTLSYSKIDDFLTVHLIAGRQIHSHDPFYNIRLPAVSIQLENMPETEVTSNPDEAPNPEYDQEFTFSLQQHELYDTRLRFIVWDIISNHETSVVGFSQVNLKDFHHTLLGNAAESSLICKDIKPTLVSEITEGLGEALVSLYYDCVTDKIVVNLRRLRKLDVQKNDQEIYVKISLLLDNDVIQCKRTTEYPPVQTTQINQSFEFSALSSDFNQITNNNSPKLHRELTIPFPDNSVSSIQSVINPSGLGFDTLKNNMGILISVRAKTLTKRKRLIGRIYIGKSDSTTDGLSDQFFHWSEMVKHFDNVITQWHTLKLSSN